MMKRTSKEYRIASIFLLVIFAVLLFSCGKNNNKTSEENKGQIFESTNNNEGYGDKSLSDNSGESLPLLKKKLPELVYDDNESTNMERDGHIPEGPAGVEDQSPPAFKDFKDMSNLYGSMITDLLYRYEPYYILEGWNYVEEKNGRVEYIKPEYIDKLESKYREKIFEFLRSTFREDRIQNLKVNLKINDTNLEKIDGEIYIKPNTCRRIVSVNIDGIWKIKYDKNNKVIITDGVIEREYIPIPANDLGAIYTDIQNIIDYNPYRMDSVTVQNIPFDRTEQFAAEDAEYFKLKRQRTKNTILFSFVGLVIISIIISLIFSIKHYKRKKV